MSVKTEEQAWVHQLLGDWTYELTTTDDSDHPGDTIRGRETVRAVSDVWVLFENAGDAGDGGSSQSVTLIGYEVAKARYTGAVAGTAASALFIYEGDVSEDGQALVLETEGPAMTAGRLVDRYRDVMRIQDRDHRTTTAEVLGTKGEWREFMITYFTRQA